jgi:hypothetical protein
MARAELASARESSMTAGNLGVMATASAVAGLGLNSGALHLVIGAMVFAPGFEPCTPWRCLVTATSAAVLLWQRRHDARDATA